MDKKLVPLNFLPRDNSQQFSHWIYRFALWSLPDTPREVLCSWRQQVFTKGQREEISPSAILNQSRETAEALDSGEPYVSLLAPSPDTLLTATYHGNNNHNSQLLGVHQAPGQGLNNCIFYSTWLSQELCELGNTIITILQTTKPTFRVAELPAQVYS